MTAPKPNAELAYRVLDTALQHEDHFAMGAWAYTDDGRPVGIDDLTSKKPNCGTTACLAGWTVAMAGYKVDSDANVFDANDNQLDIGVDDLAANMLGISEEERDDLFYCPGDAVPALVEEIFGPRPSSYGSGCHCDYLGAGTPEHTPSPLCRSLRPGAERDEPGLIEGDTAAEHRDNAYARYAADEAAWTPGGEPS